MKKILLVLVAFLLTGCYDYKELNELGIVSSILVDYKDKEFIVDVEIYNATKQEEKAKASYFVEGRGNTFESALNDANNQNTLAPYFGHMNAIVVSPAVAKEKLESMYDYLIRDSGIVKDFYLIISDEFDDIKDYESPKKTTFGESLKNLIENSEKKNSKFKTYGIREILNYYLKKKNYYLGSISIKNDSLALEDTYLISDNKSKFKIDQKAALFLNMMEGTDSQFVFEDDMINLIYDYKLETKAQKNKYIIKLSGDAKILNTRGHKIKNKEDFAKLQDSLNDKLKKYIKNCIIYAQNGGVDLYNFNYLYYEYNPKIKNDSAWKDLPYEIKSDIVISEKGLLFDTLEVKKR